MEDRFFFVNELPSDGSQLQGMRSRNARLVHRRRRIRQEMQEQRSINATGQIHDTVSSTKRLPLTRYGVYDSLPKAQHDSTSTCAETAGPVGPSADARARRASQKTGYSLLQLPGSTLLGLGPDSSPEAATDGYKCIAFFLSRASNRSMLVYPAFNLSSIPVSAWPPILTHRMLFHAAAAFMQLATHDVGEYGMFAGQLTAYRDYLQHRQKALRDLRQHIQSVIDGLVDLDPISVVAVSMLGTIDLHLGDMDSWCMHRKVLGSIVNAAGGLERLEYDARYSVASETEMAWALKTGYTVLQYAPKIKHRKYRGSVRKQEEAFMRANTIPAGFRDLYVEGNISNDLMRATARVLEGLAGKVGPESNELQSRKYKWYWDAMPYLHVDYQEELVIEDLMEMAILQFCAHTLDPTSSNSTAHHITRRVLMVQLPIWVSRHWAMTQAEARAISWMWVLTLYAWDVPWNKPLEEPAVRCLRTLPRDMMLTSSFGEIECVLKSFLWTEDFLEYGTKQFGLLFQERKGAQHSMPAA